MPSFYQWEIWQVNWTYQDGDTTEPRPALLLSSSEQTRKGLPLVFAKISGEYHDVGMVIELDPEDPEFGQTCLKKRSYIYLKNVQELEEKDILYRRGILGARTAALALETILRGTAQ